MQISEKYGLVYVITKLGLLFVYDLQTATAVYRNRISPDPIFLTANSPSSGGFYAVNRCVHAPQCCTAPGHRGHWKCAQALPQPMMTARSSSEGASEGSAS